MKFRLWPFPAKWTWCVHASERWWSVASASGGFKFIKLIIMSEPISLRWTGLISMNWPLSVPFDVAFWEQFCTLQCIAYSSLIALIVIFESQRRCIGFWICEQTSPKYLFLHNFYDSTNIQRNDRNPAREDVSIPNVPITSTGSNCRICNFQPAIERQLPPKGNSQGSFTRASPSILMIVGRTSALLLARRTMVFHLRTLIAMANFATSDRCPSALKSNNPLAGDTSWCKRLEVERVWIGEGHTVVGSAGAGEPKVRTVQEASRQTDSDGKHLQPSETSSSGAKCF